MRYRTEYVVRAALCLGTMRRVAGERPRKGSPADFYKKANITLMEARPEELANHALLDLARKASIALMEVRPAC